MVAFSVGSIITGLIAWGIPIWKLTFAHSNKVNLSVVLSCGFALLSLVIQFFDIANEIQANDISAVMDTIDVLKMIALIFSIITVFLNVLVEKRNSEKLWKER